MIISNVEVREDFDQAGADLAQSGLSAFGVIICNDTDDGRLDRGLVREQRLGVRVKILIAVRLILRFGQHSGIGECAVGSRRFKNRCCTFFSGTRRSGNGAEPGVCLAARRDGFRLAARRRGL